MARILITGSEGFIGSALKLFFKDNTEHEVFTLDITPKFNDSKNHYNMDVNEEEISNIFSKLKPEIVIHLAAQISLIESFKDPKTDAKTNIIGTINVAKACVENEVNHLIYINSAGAIYNHEKNQSTTENSLISPSSPYGISKASGEFYVRTLTANSFTKWSSLALSNVYGKFDNKRSGYINLILKNIKENKITNIFGANTTRDYIFVNDVIKAIALTLEKPLTNRINISSNIETSNLEIAEIICAKLHLDFVKHFQIFLPRPNEQLFCRISNELAFNELGWNPEYSLEKGLNEILKDFHD